MAVSDGSDRIGFRVEIGASPHFVLWIRVLVILFGFWTVLKEKLENNSDRTGSDVGPP